MKIVMFTNNYTPYTGGVVNSINSQVSALRRLGHVVTVVTFDFAKTEYKDPSWVIRLHCPIKFMYKKNHMAIAWRPKKQIRKILGEIDPHIVHVHHPFLLGAVGASVAKEMDIPIVFTFHTMYEEYAHYVPLVPYVVTRAIIRGVIFPFCDLVDHIIAPSDSIKEYLINHGVTTEITVMPSGLLRMFLPVAVRERTKTKRLRLLVVSRMVKEKKIQDLLLVAHTLLEIKVPFTMRLIGYGHEYEELKNHAYTILKLPPKTVSFIHKPSRDVIVDAYQTADLFLFSSTTDTQGLVLAEAMASGVPVIAVDGPGQRDIIKHKENGYIVSSIFEMAQVISRLSFRPEKLDHLSENAYKTGQRYHPDILVRRLFKLYSSVLWRH